MRTEEKGYRREVLFPPGPFLQKGGITGCKKGENRAPGERGKRATRGSRFRSPKGWQGEMLTFRLERQGLACTWNREQFRKTILKKKKVEEGGKRID